MIQVVLLHFRDMLLFESLKHAPLEEARNPLREFHVSCYNEGWVNRVPQNSKDPLREFHVSCYKL